jgi:hypothetical protein
MPGTGAKNGLQSVRWKSEMSCHINIMNISSETSPNPISTSSVLCSILWKYSRVRNMPGTSAVNGPGSVRCKPETSRDIKFMDISSETSQNHFCTSPVLCTSLREPSIMQNMPGTGAEIGRGSIRWKHKCHVTLNAWKSAVNRPHFLSLHLRCSVLHFESFRESGHAWYWCKEWPTKCLRETRNVMSH